MIGIDISKKWFDCYWFGPNGKRRFSNIPDGWQQLPAWAGPDLHVVMEASGPYYLGLASWLHGQGYAVSVENPLVIRRYAQMKMARTKTDPIDARVNCRIRDGAVSGSLEPALAGMSGLKATTELAGRTVAPRGIVLGQTFAVGKKCESFNEKKALAA